MLILNIIAVCCLFFSLFGIEKVFRKHKEAKKLLSFLKTRIFPNHFQINEQEAEVERHSFNLYVRFVGFVCAAALSALNILIKNL
jgi:hypothetical protein